MKKKIILTTILGLFLAFAVYLIIKNVAVIKEAQKQLDLYATLSVKIHDEPAWVDRRLMGYLHNIYFITTAIIESLCIFFIWKKKKS